MAINCNPSALANAARCFKICVSQGGLQSLKTYILCQIASVGIGGPNLIPPNSLYGGGAIPEFDLTVSPNTSYVIDWGANELYMTLCGVTYPSTGAGTSTVVLTGSCTLMQFFGTFAGTTVTARVHATRVLIPTPTGFTLTLSGTVTAAWNNPSLAYVTYAEVWRSGNGVTYTLGATVNFPSTSASFTAPVAGTSLYCKVRWCGPTGCGGFSEALAVPYTSADTWESYPVGAAVFNLNAGDGPWSSSWRASLPPYVIDTWESYTVGSNVNGLNGGASVNGAAMWPSAWKAN